MKTEHYKTSKRTILTLALSVFLLITLVLTDGCGKKEEEAQSGFDREYFAGWLKYSTEAFELRYPPSEDLSARIAAIGVKCDEIIVLLAQMLRHRPDGKIYVMIFQNSIEARKLLGREVPYTSNDTIYYEIFSPLGKGITEIMMRQVAPEGSKFEFVNEGFPTLLDFSGENYHANVFQHLENGTIIPIADLIDNEKYLKLPAIQRKEQAASFLGFLTLNYGSAPLLGFLKESISANGIMMMTTKRNLEVLEYEWKNSLPQLAVPPPPDSTVSEGTGA